MKIYITRKIPEAGLDLIQKKFGPFKMNPRDRVLTKNELKKNVKGCDAILSLLTDKIDAEIMEAAGNQLKVISNYAVGVDNIDLKEASKRGILVTNTPGVLTQTSAEMAWALLFSTARRIAEADSFTRKGKFKGWGPLSFLGLDITGKTLGVIGAGRIGTAFALMSKGFKMRVLYYNRSVNSVLEKEIGAEKVDLSTLLKISDFVSIHLPLTAETKMLIGKKELQMMKPTALLINTSRGAVINEKSLAQALQKRTIFGAGLDVYEFEPKVEELLKKLPNVVLAPHIASATIETRNKMAVMAAQNLIQGLTGEKPKNLVN